jgi:hypothetical protein
MIILILNHHNYLILDLQLFMIGNTSLKYCIFFFILELIANSQLNDTKLISKSITSSYMDDIDWHILTPI